MFNRVNSIHNEGDYVVITGKKFLGMFHNVSMPVIQNKTYAKSGPYLHYLRLPNYGIELTFADSIVEVFINGQQYCWLNNTFKGAPAKDVHVKDDLLMFIGKNDELVTYSIPSIVAKSCLSINQVNGVTSFCSTNHANGPFLITKDSEFIWGNAKAKMTEVPVNKWKVATSIRADRVLVAGIDENSQTNYFVLLDTNLQVLDKAQIPKPAKECSID